MVVPCADVVLVHRRAQHGDRRDPQDLSGRRAVQAARVEFAAKAKRARAEHDRHQPPARALRPPDRPQPADRLHLRRPQPSTGFAGDTIASALLANGQWMISRSFKYHRPRGVLTMAGQDANTLVQVGDEPNVPRRSPRRSPTASRSRPELCRQPRERPRRLDRAGRPLPAGRLLLQGLLQAEGRLEALGADHPPHGRPRRASTLSRPSRLFRQGVSVRRCRGDRRRPGRAWRRRWKRRRAAARSS